MRIINQITSRAVLVFLLACSVCAAKTIYVDDDAAGANDGSSWENAYVYLQDAFADANESEKPVEIRVAQGIYKPNGGIVAMPEFDFRTLTFQLINGVALKGGYAGAADLNVRDFVLYETVLSGDLAGNDVDVNDPKDRYNEIYVEPTRAENSYHIVTGSGTDDTAVLDGLTVTGGFRAGMYNDSGSPTVTNCTFTENCGTWAGHGMYNYESSPTLIDCTFSGNFGAVAGGGMYNEGGSPTLTNCVFIRNFAWGGLSGGGMYNDRSNPTLTDCIFIENSSGSGGGMANSESSPILTGCTFSRNYANRGGGMRNVRQSSPTLNNCIFNGNDAHYGGGMSNGGESNPKLTNCTFSDNSANSGGGMYNVAGHATLVKCTFSGNWANSGGGMKNSRSSPILNNCVISGNNARHGGGISNGRESSPTLTNCTFSGNSATWGGGVYGSYDSGNSTLINCILWDDAPEEIYGPGESAMVAYSNVEGGFPGEGNVDKDPLFANPGHWIDIDDPNIIIHPWDPNIICIGGDYHLKSQAGRWDPNTQTWVTDDVTSPCIDAGDPNIPVGDEPFPSGIRINMGAYGGTTEASKSISDISEVVNVNDSDNGSQVTIKQGQILAVTLESNPTTGYSWYSVEKQDSIFEPFGEPIYFPAEEVDGIAGAGGWEILYFRSMNIGQETLELVYRRSWETDVEPIKTFSIDVTVN